MHDIRACAFSFAVPFSRAPFSSIRSRARYGGGVILLSYSQVNRDNFLGFRREIIQSVLVRWASNAPLSFTISYGRLGPKKFFSTSLFIFTLLWDFPRRLFLRSRNLPFPISTPICPNIWILESVLSLA